jgi:hypothetical protein
MLAVSWGSCTLSLTSVTGDVGDVGFAIIEINSCKQTTPFQRQDDLGLPGGIQQCEKVGGEYCAEEENPPPTLSSIEY